MLKHSILRGHRLAPDEEEPASNAQYYGSSFPHALSIVEYKSCWRVCVPMVHGIFQRYLCTWCASLVWMSGAPDLVVVA